MSSPIPVCVLNDTRVDRHHGCERVMGAIETLLERHGMQVVGACPAHADWRQQPGFLRALEGSRLLLVNGEGTLHHDRPAARRLLEAGAHCARGGVPAVLVNAGWEANGPQLQAMLEDFALVAVRDSASAARDPGRRPRLPGVPDLSLYGPAQAPAAAARERIVFTDSVDPLQVGGAGTLPPPGGRRHAVHRLSAARRRPANLRFLRQGFAARDALSPARLMRIVQLRHRLCRTSFTRTEPFLSALARYRLLVSGRFHACTLALITGTPFISLPSNTGKIAALVADMAWRPGARPRRSTPAASRRPAMPAGPPRKREAIASHLDAARIRVGTPVPRHPGAGAMTTLLARRTETGWKASLAAQACSEASNLQPASLAGRAKAWELARALSPAASRGMRSTRRRRWAPRRSRWGSRTCWRRDANPPAKRN
jgi:hypothetical protein